MFSDITYVWRANSALTALGFPINTLPGDFRVRLWSLSKQMGLSPKEAACAFVLDLPARQRPSHAAGLMDRWIIGGDVRPGMIEAAQRAKEEAALALNSGQEKHNVAPPLGEHGEQRETTMFGFGRGSAVRLRAEQVSVTLSTIKQVIRGKSFEERCAALLQHGFVGEVHPPPPHDLSGRGEFSFVEASPSLRDFRYHLFSTSMPSLLSMEGDGAFFGVGASMLSEDSGISVFSSQPVAAPMGRDARAFVRELCRLPGFSDISSYMR